MLPVRGSSNLFPLVDAVLAYSSRHYRAQGIVLWRGNRLSQRSKPFASTAGFSILVMLLRAESPLLVKYIYTHKVDIILVIGL
jgi:hypothetical protein